MFNASVIYRYIRTNLFPWNLFGAAAKKKVSIGNTP